MQPFNSFNPVRVLTVGDTTAHAMALSEEITARTGLVDVPVFAAQPAYQPPEPPQSPDVQEAYVSRARERRRRHMLNKARSVLRAKGETCQLCAAPAEPATHVFLETEPVARHAMCGPHAHAFVEAVIKLEAGEDPVAG